MERAMDIDPLDEIKDLPAILLNRANNIGGPCADLLRLAASRIEKLEHRIRHGDWPKPPPPELEGLE